MQIGTPEIILILWPTITIVAIIDILKNEFNGNNKLIWVLFVIFAGPIGSLLYYFIGTKQKINKN